MYACQRADRNTKIRCFVAGLAYVSQEKLVKAVAPRPLWPALLTTQKVIPGLLTAACERNGMRAIQ